MYCRRSIIAHQ